MKALFKTQPDVAQSPLEMASAFSSVPDDDQHSALPNGSSYLVLSDVLSLLAAFVLAGLSAFVISQTVMQRDYVAITDRDIGWRLIQFGAFSGVILMWLHNRGHYRSRLPFWTEIRDIVVAIMAAALVDGFLQYVTRVSFSRLWLVQGWVLATVLVIVFRHGAKIVLRRMGLWSLRTVLIGSGRNVEDARLALESEPNLGYSIVQVMALDEIAKLRGSNPWNTLCREHEARFIVLALDAVEIGQSLSLVTSLTKQNCPYAIMPTAMRGLPVMGMESQYFFSHDLMMLVGRNNLARPFARSVKRAFDFVLAAFILLWFSPVFLATMLAVRMDGGPAFFGHRRIGHGGKVFSCLKFRTMVVDADAVIKELLLRDPEAAAEWRRDFKLRFDPRVTTIGNFLRRTSLDELPQLINVLRGDMSLVGPRPIIGAEVERYGSDIDYYYGIKPGITGLWQVSGRNNIDYARRVQIDSWYVKNWSLWHDIAILFKTIPAVLLRRGAY